MTTTQTPVDALMALVRDYGFAQSTWSRLNPAELLDKIEASARALAAIPEGFALVSVEQLTVWKAMANQTAALTLKRERHAVGRELKSEIADVIADPLNIAGDSAPTPPTAPAQDAQGVPYAYAVYFPNQQREELVHDTDDVLEDMTNDTHTVTELFAALRASSPAEPRNAPLYDPADAAFQKRPPYCGSGHCSCIECHFPVTKERT